MNLSYTELVMALKKDPVLIALEMSSDKADLMHMAMGIAGEAGELLDAIKKHVVYNKPLDLVHVVEEFGDIEFYLEGLRQRLSLEREDILTLNQEKLEKRYGNSYSDTAASTRADKA